MRKAAIAALALSLVACNHSKNAVAEATAIPSAPENWGVKANIASWGNGAPSLDLRVPSEWKYERHSPADFDLNYFIDPNGAGSLFIYVGHHPNADSDKVISKTRIMVGTIPTDFIVSQSDGSRKTQAIVSDFYPKGLDGGVSELKLHIVIFEKKAGFTENAIKALSTLRLGRRT